MRSTPKRATEQWSSQMAFMVAAVGSSVGLGNLWRFSAEAGSNGGSAFIGIYLLCVLFIGIPIIMSELLIGRAGGASSAIESADDLATRSQASRRWSVGVWVGSISSFLIVSFYCVVAAWVLAYIPRFLNSAFEGQTPSEIAQQFDVLIASPNDLLVWFFLFAGLTIWLVSRGVNRGLELASKVLMPTFFVLLIGLSIYSMITGWGSGGTQAALDFMFNADASKITGKIAVSALGQAFFSLGLGMAIMIAYGSYLPKSINIPQSALVIGLSDTLVALFAGLAIFPIVFRFGLDFEAGAGLFFQTLPTALLATPAGNMIGAAFFCMAFFAALTTSVSLLEPSVAYVAERFKLNKARAAIVVGLMMICVGLGCLYNLSLLSFLDTGLTAPILLPFSALVIVIFVGWRLDRKILNHELNSSDMALGKFLLTMTRFVAPAMIGVILMSGVYDQYFS